MIFLFDDTTEDFRKKYIDLTAFKDVIVHFGAITSSKLEEIRVDLSNSDCILIHRSLRDADNPNRNDVYESILDISDMGDSIPLVIFSGEDSEEAVFDGDTFIQSFNKTCLYENLSFFLKSFATSKVIDLKTLVHGERIQSRLALNEGVGILKKFRLLNPDEPFDATIIEGQDLHSLVQRASPTLGRSYSDIIAEVKTGRISASEFIRRIRSIIDSFSAYGKNIYRWGS